MLASSMRYVKRNYWSIHGSSLAALPRPVNVAGRIHLLSPGPGDRLRNDAKWSGRTPCVG
jgi:hypothetical protein